MGEQQFAMAFPAWNKRTFVWNTNLPEDGSYENFIGGIASQPTKLETVAEVNQSIGDILEYFDNDSTRFTVFLSRFLDKIIVCTIPQPKKKKQKKKKKRKRQLAPRLKSPHLMVRLKKYQLQVTYVMHKKCAEEHLKLQ